MKLSELKKMIKEEFDSYVGEAEEDVDVAVDTDAGDIDAAAETEMDPEETLRNVYDMLKTYFEGEEEDMGDEETPEDMGDEEAPEDMGGEEELEEVAGTGFGDAGSKNSSGANVGYTPAKKTTGDKKLHESKALQERFQKLANIIK